MTAPGEYGIIYNWDGAPHGYSAAPQSLDEFLRFTYAPLVDTQVGALFWCVGEHAARWSIPSLEQLGDIHGRRYESAAAYHHTENIRRMVERGQDPQAALIERGLWSQYLEVGIGPYVEVFSKAPPMSAVGVGEDVGLHPDSVWNNPEPETVLVIDAQEGVQENSRRHGYMLGVLGIRHMAVVVNKMDLVGYDETAYHRTVDEYGAFLELIGVRPAAFLPVSGREGDNLIRASSAMPWYQGPNLLEVLDAFDAAVPPRDQPFRMPVQGVYKFTANDDDRRIVAGTVTSGTVSVGDDIVFYPSGKHSRIKLVEGFNSASVQTVGAGMAVGFTLEEQIYVTRGEIATRAAEPRPGR